MEMQRIWNSQSFFKKNNVGRLLLPDFNAFYKTIIIKTQWYHWKSRPINQWNRREFRNRLTWSIDFDEGTRAIQWQRETLFNKLVLEQLGIYQGKNRHHTLPKINQKWIIDLNVKPKTIKLLKETVTENLCNFKIGKDMLNTTHKKLIENW